MTQDTLSWGFLHGGERICGGGLIGDDPPADEHWAPLDGSEVWNNAAILTQGDRIAWVGPAAELPQSLPGVIDDIVDVDQVENLNGGLVTPGLIDAHTHPVYAGNRWAELAMRSGGSSLNEIAAAGGGMASTVTVTRGTDPWTLCNGVAGTAVRMAPERDHHDRGQDRVSPDPGR
jgi:imidazolonepropionase-like amidohydrolase